MATKEFVDRWVAQGKKSLDPLGPENRCRDYDDDCAEVPDKVHCWLHDPEQGWCPYLLGKA